MSRRHLIIAAVIAAAGLLASSPCAAQQAVVPEDAGIIGVFTSGGGCANCIPQGTLPARCEAVCEMPLTAFVLNQTPDPVTVEVTLMLDLPTVLPYDPCGNGDKVRTVTCEVPGQGFVAIDFGQVIRGPSRAGIFSVVAVVVGSSVPGQIGASAESAVPVAGVPMRCQKQGF